MWLSKRIAHGLSFNNIPGNRREKTEIAFTKRNEDTFTPRECFVLNYHNLMQEFSYRRGDYLLFGSKTSGLPPEALSDCKNEPYGGGTIRIPMVETYVRCLNLSVSVGVALYEASRQLNYEQIECAPEGVVSGEEPFWTEDIFA